MNVKEAPPYVKIWSDIIDIGREEFNLPTFTILAYLHKEWDESLGYFDYPIIFDTIRNDFRQLQTELGTP